MAAIAAIPSTTAANDFADACRRFAAARVVFIGRVTSPPVRLHVSGDEQMERFRKKYPDAAADMAKDKFWPPPLDSMMTPMRVEAAYRNIETATVYVRVTFPPELRVGESYLVYGHYAIDSVFPDLVISTDVLPHPDPDGEVVRFLNLARTQKFNASIYGSLVLHDFPAEVPLAGVPIRFTVNDQVFDAITNASGRFIAAGMPAGIISVEPVMPAGVLLSTVGPVPYRVALPDGGCSELQLRAISNRHIRGKVLQSDGTPIASARISLTPLADAAPRWQSQSQTNGLGEFEFRGVPRGTYVIGINLDSAPTSAAPYTAAYYPTPIEVGDQLEHDNIEWILGPPLPTGEIEVVVDAGKGMAESITVCAIPLAGDGKRYGSTQSIGRTSRGIGPVILPVVEGVQYRVAARASVGNRNFDSDPIDVVGAAGRQSLTLRPNAPARPDPNVCGVAF